MSLPLNQVILGDCVEVMAEWPENSVDCIVTVPPYGISFMGKEWDKALPPSAAFEQMIRVLKPGALAFVMSSPRQDVLWRMLAMLEGVGFQLKTSAIFWIYKTGFPKSFDVSKGIDRRNKRTQEDFQALASFLKNRRIELGVTQREIASHFPSKTGRLTGCVANWELGYNLPTKEQWETLKIILDFDGSNFDEIINRIEAERKIIVERTMIQGGGTSYELRVGDRREVEANITAPNLDDAKQWEGWKSQTSLKPAAEVVLMVNKPRSEKTIVDNVLRWGTGAINVDACRVPYENDKNPATNPLFRKQGGYENKYWVDINSSSYSLKKVNGERNPNEKGRFPSNLLISDGALDTGKTTKSGKFEPHHKIAKDEKGHSIKNVYGKYKHLPADQQVFYGDEGSPYRYFDLDSWAEHHGFLDVAKPSREERNFGLWDMPKGAPPGSKRSKPAEGRKNPLGESRSNYHPTVKPVKLMAYLIELGCPPDGVVVDPFVGSGTTCIAAKRLRRKWIGIEINPEYAQIAEARINIRGPLDQYLEA